MNILVSGSSGLIGTALISKLERSGHTVARLVRRRSRLNAGEIPWSPAERLDPALLSGSDAVVHLAGRNLAGFWTEKTKREIRGSRIGGTDTLARAVVDSFRACGRPGVMVSASAIGYYGSRGDELLTESSANGEGFLAQLCRDWEWAASQTSLAGVRLVLPRLGIVLSTRGGALAKMLPLFRVGVGGHLGNGRQYWSWITLDDAVSAIAFALGESALSGPVNLCSPNPVTNAEFTHTLAHTLHRAAIFPVPAFALRLALRDMATETMLASQRVQPEKLTAAGFQFAHPRLEQALQAVLAR